MDVYHILRQFYHLFPDGSLKRRLVGWVYRFLHRSAVNSYTYDRTQQLWRVTTRDGITLLSLRDFDPAPLTDPELQALSPGDNVLDLGGNIGMVAIYMAHKVGPEGHVWVYEPDRKNQKLLQQHLTLNGVSNVTLVPAGVWRESGTLTFYEGGTYTSSFVMTDYIEKQPDHYEVTSIPVVTLDEEYHRHQWKKLDFIKMDIEGSETKALEGARTLLSELSPLLLIETHTSEGKCTAPEIRAWLTSLGYQVTERRREHNPTLIASKPATRRQP